MNRSVFTELSISADDEGHEGSAAFVKRMEHLRQGFRCVITNTDGDRQIVVFRTVAPNGNPYWDVTYETATKSYQYAPDVLFVARRVLGDRVLVPTEDTERPPVRLGPREWVAVPAGQ